MRAYPPAPPLPRRIRFITATALFDGHDAAINIIRRILQDSGVEVIHLGHHRAVEDIVEAALQEDVQGIAVSSYQGGHVEFFKYMIDLLRARGGADIQVFGGGGGVIVPHEIAELQAYGVAHLYSVEDGQHLGLQGMIDDMLARLQQRPVSTIPPDRLLADVAAGDRRAWARLVSAVEDDAAEGADALKALLQQQPATRCVPVVGITGTGGAGKSSLTDELLRRFRLDQADRFKVAILSIDPSRRRSGGALLGDRIRMNAIAHPNIVMRSLATRESGNEICAALPQVIQACKWAGFDLVIVETAGIGQGDAAIVAQVDVTLYVMTPEFGAASQLEKIDMLDFADFVVINKFDRKGAEDALRDVRKQYQRNHQRFSERAEAMPVFGTVASHFNDEGVTALYQALLPRLSALGLAALPGRLATVNVRHSSPRQAALPAERVRYLADIARTVRAYHQRIRAQSRIARERQALQITQGLLVQAGHSDTEVAALAAATTTRLDVDARRLLEDWPQVRAASRDTVETLSGTAVPKVALPAFEDAGELLRFLMQENLPGRYPYTAGVFAFKREHEDPTRMFAGEGDAFRTNRRFHTLSAGLAAKRLSTAFDSVTLYGEDPAERPDIYGKIGNAGVSIATLDDLKVLYSGFDLCDPATSVSMTINGPAPILLAMFFNVAIDQQVELFHHTQGRVPTEAESAEIRQRVLSTLRGTVQADILKEDQGQNTCIFSTEFALKLMSDIQRYFICHQVRNFYSVSISGYHIAEAGANPITQLAFTLANGLTYVESWLARGMAIDAFAPNLSFFFSNGMDAEYSVIGRVARRIWAVAMKEFYGANERSQKLKYHIQTSGRSLHAQEMAFNDIRTTLQALIASDDHCNSLHTNAYDEAITTPTEESVRRALAIQLIINREWGLSKNQNPNQGSFIIEELTDLVEEAVLREFDAIAARGGVFGAMETGYQRGRIQDESLLYEQRKHEGSYPIVGVNTFLPPQGARVPEAVLLARSTEAEKQSQLQRLREFQTRHRDDAACWLSRLKQAALSDADANLFEVLMEAVRYCSLGQITAALFEVGGQYRRNM
ncbi:MAG: cobalamin-dependent protein [Sterolibacterium sp.]|jgi:methylmalonyl-CoA mutase|nr:cobalamin-dependent protein [Sterolibacterium sp.]